MHKKFLFTIICLLLLVACKIEHNYRPGGPYYYKGWITYEGHFPSDEITKAEAEALASQGYAYCVAYFNDHKLPVLIEKRYKGQIEKVQLEYSEDHLIKAVTTDPKGTVVQTEELSYKDGDLYNASSTDRFGNKRWYVHEGKRNKPSIWKWLHDLFT